MPLTAEIKINGTPIKTIWIGRLEPLRGENKNHTYRTVVIDGPLPEHLAVPEDGTLFRHRYSDGAAECVRRAIVALQEMGELP